MATAIARWMAGSLSEMRTAAHSGISANGSAGASSWARIIGVSETTPTRPDTNSAPTRTVARTARAHVG
jgi:hypothetical protein